MVKNEDMITRREKILKNKPQLGRSGFPPQKARGCPTNCVLKREDMVKGEEKKSKNKCQKRQNHQNRQNLQSVTGVHPEEIHPEGLLGFKLIMASAQIP